MLYDKVKNENILNTYNRSINPGNLLFPPLTTIFSKKLNLISGLISSTTCKTDSASPAWGRPISEGLSKSSGI